MELENQLSRVRNQLLLDGYSRNGVRNYDHCWNYLKVVANERGFSCYSEELAVAFLDSRKRQDENFKKNEKKYRRSIEVIRCFLVEGTIASPVLRSEKLSNHLQLILDEYSYWLVEENQSKSSVKTKRSRTRIFYLILKIANSLIFQNLLLTFSWISWNI